MISLSLFSLIGLFTCLRSSTADNVPLLMLKDARAKCLDGTQAGFYYQSARDTSASNKWIIYLNGGGECDSEDACKAQTQASLGSSKYFASQADARWWYLASDNCDGNPDFCNWNHVLNPYCTQDLHAGMVETPNADTWGLYFSGYHVMNAILDALDASANSLHNATDIILHGVSAGGIGVWMLLDALAARYPKARVVGAPLAGHYFYATYYDGPNHTEPGGMADFREGAWDRTYNLYQAFVDEDCRLAHTALGLSAGACMLSNNSLPYISSEVYITQALTDQVVLTGHDNWPEQYMYDAPEQSFMQEWYANMTVALRPILQGARKGAFAAACYTHTGFDEKKPLVNGLNFYQAFGEFYFNRVAEGQCNYVDSCGVMCNPTC